MEIKEIMKEPVVIDKNIKIKDASKIMSENRIGSLLVLKNKKLAGIITERDILKNINKLDSGVYEIMSTNVITIESNDTIDHAAIIMTEKKIKKLPVLKKSVLVGIITATDLIAHSEDLNEDFFFD